MFAFLLLSPPKRSAIDELYHSFQTLEKLCDKVAADGLDPYFDILLQMDRDRYEIGLVAGAFRAVQEATIQNDNDLEASMARIEEVTKFGLTVLARLKPLLDQARERERLSNLHPH